MPIWRPCLGCSKLVVSPSSRCAPCATEYERARLAAEPWQVVYDLARWKNVKNRVRRRDGYRCTFEVEGRRCPNTNMNGFVSVHHIVKLREIWRRHGGPQNRGPGWKEFLDAAYDESNLATLCSRHHLQADSRSFSPNGPRRATADARARRRHGRRREGQNPDKSYDRDRKKDWG